MHGVLEEATLFGSTVVEEDQGILNRDDTVIDTLEQVNTAPYEQPPGKREKKKRLTFRSSRRQFGWSTMPVSTSENFFCAPCTNSSVLAYPYFSAQLSVILQNISLASHQTTQCAKLT